LIEGIGGVGQVQGGKVGEAKMRFFWLMLLAMLALGAMVLSPRASTQQRSVVIIPGSHLRATMMAAHSKCGGEELYCGGSLVKVCNPKNGKCCCATAGAYR
jgi:hypothetical protein